MEVHTAGPSTEGSNTNSDILSELRLLRNEINVIKVKQNEIINSLITSQSIITSPTIHPQVNPVPASDPNTVTGDQVGEYVNMEDVNFRPPSNSAMLQNQPVHGFQLPEFMETTGITFDSSLNGPQYLNPFIPPPKINMLKKMEKLEYVDFEELLPSLPSAARFGNEQYFDIDIETSALRLKPKERRQSINNLASWMLAWNHFMQATLLFWPRMFYKLFTYQKNFCRLTTKYKFEACYTYDRDFRLLQVSQTSMKPEQRTAKWETVHPELTNMHLQADSMLPVCFHCRSTGHYATNCPSKATGARSNGETGNMFRNAATNVHQAFRSTANHHNTVPATEPTRYTVNRNAVKRIMQ